MPKTVLDEMKAQLQSRAKELKPLHDEYMEVTIALERLDGASAPVKVARPSAVSAPPKPKSKPKAGASRRGRPKGSGQRAQQAVEIVTKNPGIALPEIAKKMGIKDNYLYRVLPGLQAEGKIKKDGKGWFPA